MVQKLTSIQHQLKVGLPPLLTLVAITISVTTASASEETAEKAYQLSKQAYNLLERNPQRAAELLWQSAALNPNDGNTQYNLGVAFIRLNRMQDACNAYRKAVALGPAEFDHWRALAQTYVECKNNKNALWAIAEIKRRFPTRAKELTDELTEAMAYQASSASASPQSGNKANSKATVPNINELRTMVNKNPNDGNAHWELGHFLGESKQFKAAVQELSRASELLPTDPKPLQSLMWAQGKAGDLEGLQSSRNLYVKRFPNASDVQTIKDQIAYYGSDFANTRSNEKSRAQGGKSYDTAAYSIVQMPLKVCLPVGSVLDGKYRPYVERACQEWAAATNYRLRFVMVTNPADAGLVCKWTNDKSQLHHSFAIGETQHGTNSAGDDQATVYLLLKEDNSINDSEFYDTCLHEIGHAIGLSHSSNPQDVMYNASNTENGLTANDKARARELYGH